MEVEVGKRYVFWRKPTGEPHFGNDDKHAPVSLLAEIGKTMTVTPGGFSRPWVGPDEMEFAVKSMAVVIDPNGKELHEVQSSSIVYKGILEAIRQSGGGKPIKAGDVIAEANKLAAEYFRQPLVNYVLVSSLSVEGMPTGGIEIDGCEISRLESRGKYPYPSTIKRRTFGHLYIAKHLESSEYQLVTVTTTGRTISEATEKALGALHLLRGYWTLFGTYGRWTVRFSSSPTTEAVGEVHTGPIHTLHNLDGTLPADVYWFDSNYGGDQKLFCPKKGWDGIEKQRQASMKKLADCPYRQDVEQLIRRFVSALDYTNFDIAFLQMWGILEKVTDTVGANYDETIRRATWIFGDREIASEILEHLRFRRNRYVHAAHSSEQADQIVYSIKSYIEPHLLALIRNDFEVRSLREYGECLALSSCPGSA